MYAVQADFENQYSVKEAIELTDRGLVQTNAVVTAVMDAALQNAEAELNVILSCCYSIKTIANLYANTITVPILRKWTCEIARYLLAINLRSREHKIVQDYEEFKKLIAEICKCQGLIDSNGDEVPKKDFNAYAVVDEPGCYPSACACKCIGLCSCAALGHL